MKIIHTENLTRTYTVGSSRVNALCSVNLDVEGGEFVALMGASGCGKSTMMHLLGCLDTPTAGRYLLEGERCKYVIARTNDPRCAELPHRFRFPDFQPVATP